MDLLTARRSPNSARPLHTQKQCTARGSSCGFPSLFLTTKGSWIHLWGGTSAVNYYNRLPYIHTHHHFKGHSPGKTFVSLISYPFIHKLCRLLQTGLNSVFTNFPAHSMYELCLYKQCFNAFTFPSCLVSIVPLY